MPGSNKIDLQYICKHILNLSFLKHHIQMASMAPKHITQCPPTREPYYQSTGTEPEPSPWVPTLLLLYLNNLFYLQYNHYFTKLFFKLSICGLLLTNWLTNLHLNLSILNQISSLQGDEILSSGGNLIYCYIPEHAAPYVGHE